MNKDEKKSRLFSRLHKTSSVLSSGLVGFLKGGSLNFEDTVFEELEDHLIMTDVGIEASSQIILNLKKNAFESRIQNLESLKLELVRELSQLLVRAEKEIKIESKSSPFVILVVGVNGVGKTTTSAKLAALLKRKGHSVVLAACDTFRAAAIEQLEAWGDKLGVAVISQNHGSDAAAVAHDAMNAAKSRGSEVLIVDSAGRQHVNTDLMNQLRKIKSVISKVEPLSPQETMLVVDGCTGQNALSQASAFRDVVNPTCVCITKLDGTAKGGIVIPLFNEFCLPVPYIGIGEGSEDLQIFNAEEYAQALIG